MEVTMFIDHPHRTHSNVTEHLNGSCDTFPCSLGGDVRADPDRHPHYTIGLTLSCIYIIFLFPIGFFGNILILTVNLGHKGRMSAPDLYFVNLAAADLILVADSLIEVFNLSPRYYDNMVTLCTFMELFLQVNMYSSVFFLTWMSLDRFAALGGCFTLGGCSPGGQKGWGGLGRRMPHARLSCCLIWGTSALLTLLPFTIAQLQHAGETHFCFGNVSQIQWLEVTLGFLVPFSVLGLCYWRIGHVLGRSHREHDSSGLRRRPRRQKALKMISAAVLVFFLCWLPENVFISVHLLRGDPDEDGTSGGLGAGTLWHDYPLTAHMVSLAAFSNSCLNPLVYSFLGETFRDKLRVFLKQNASWAMLHSSHLGNSSDQPAGNSQPPPSSYCLHKPVMHPSNPNLPDILHHKYALDS